MNLISLAGAFFLFLFSISACGADALGKLRGSRTELSAAADSDLNRILSTPLSVGDAVFWQWVEGLNGVTHKKEIVVGSGGSSATIYDRYDVNTNAVADEINAHVKEDRDGSWTKYIPPTSWFGSFLYLYRDFVSWEIQQRELRYNHMFKKGDRIYRVTTSVYMGGGRVYWAIETPTELNTPGGDYAPFLNDGKISIYQFNSAKKHVGP